MNFKILIWVIAFILLISTAKAGFDLYDNVTIHYNLTVNQSVWSPLFCNFTGGECYNIIQLTSISQWSNQSDNASKLESQTSGYYLNTTQEGDLNVNKSSFWDDLNSPSDITGLLMSQIADIWSTVVESITSSNIYIILSGSTGNVTITFNETKLNETTTAIVQESNTSLKGYVDSQDLLFNSSVKNYSDAQDEAWNDSMKTYVDAQDVVFNDSARDFTIATNTTLWHLINDSNESMRVLLVDSNNSMEAFVISTNSTLWHLINDSNTSMLNYADITFISKSNESLLDVNSSLYAANAGNSSLLNDQPGSYYLDDTNISKWITTKPHLYNDSDTIYFNESQLEVIFYNASSIEVVTGTGSGTLEDIQTYNRVYYNITEVNSDYELLVNFTGVVDFTTLIVRHKTNVDGGHISSIEIWDYTDSDWEGYGYLTEATTSEIKTLGVYDAEEHISDGIVQVRFFQEDVGVNHIHHFDWVAISKGFGTPVGREIDPLSIHRDGNTPLTGNWDAGYNITAAWFIGLLNWSNIQNAIITTVDNLYLQIVGTTITFNESYAADNLHVNSSSYATNAGNASQLNDQAGSYYLDNTNCSTDQSCDTILYHSDSIAVDITNVTNYVNPDTNVTTICTNADEILLQDGTCKGAGNYTYTNASPINMTGNIFGLSACANPEESLVWDGDSWNCTVIIGADTNESTRFDNLVGTACGSGDFVFNISEDGTIQCDTAAGAGDITSVTTEGIYITNGSTSGAVHLLFNQTLLNSTIDTRDTNCSGQTCEVTNTGTLDGYEAAALLDNTNCSVDQACDTILYTTDEANLDVNSSNYWDTANTRNSSVFNIIAGELGVLMSLWEGLFIKLTTAFGGNITGTYDSLSLAGDSVDSSNIVDGSVADIDIANSSNWATAYTERGSQIAGTSLSWDGSELDVDDDFVKIAGDDMTGNLAMGGNNITNVTRYTFNADPSHNITSNATCVIIQGDTTIFSIC